MNDQKGIETTKSLGVWGGFFLRKQNLTRKTAFFRHVCMSTLGKLPLRCTHFVWIIFKQPKCEDICSTKQRWTVTSIAVTVGMHEGEGKCRQEGGDGKYNRYVPLGHGYKREPHIGLGATVFIQSKFIQINNLTPSISQCSKAN